MKVNYSSRRALVNGGVSASQVVLISVVMLVSYRLAVQTVGQHQFGLYSLYFAFGTLTQLGSLGFGAGAARHAAIALGQGRRDDLRPIVWTSVAVTLIGSTIIGAVLLVCLQAYTATSLGPADRELARSLAPIVLAAACLAPVSTAVQGLMDGTSRSYVRGAVVMLGSVLYLGVVVAGLGSRGIVALAYGTLLQQGFVLVVLLGYLWTLSRGSRGALHLPPDLGEMTKYNLRLHLLTLPTLAYEPVAKGLIDVFAGLSAIAHYEIASRILQQVSALVHAANQAIVPVIAVRATSGVLSVGAAFRRTFHAVFPFTMLGFGGALLALPVISTFVFGESDPQVLAFGAVLAVGWVANCLSGPAYFVGVTLDNFRVNIVANYAALFVLAAAGALLGWWAGGYGLATAVTLALVVASIIVNGEFMSSTGVSLRSLVPGSEVRLAIVVGALVAGVLALGTALSGAQLIGVTVLGLLCWVVVASAAVRRSPVIEVLRTRTDADA